MGSKKNHAIAIGVSTGLLALATWAHAALPQMRIVTATGVTLPSGAEPGTPVRLSTAVNGDTAYVATDLASDREIVVHEIDKQPQVVLRSGDASPNGIGTIEDFGSIAMSPTRLLFQARTSENDLLLLSHAESGIRLLNEEQRQGHDLRLEATNARGDALLRRVGPMSAPLDALTLVLEDAEQPLTVVRHGEAIPSVPGSVFDLVSVDSTAYLADDRQVVFASAFGGGTVDGTGVFFLPGDGTIIEQVMVPFPGLPDGTEVCCKLLGADDDGIVAITGYRANGEHYLFVGKPPDISLVLTVPFEGLTIPNLPELRLPNLFMWNAAVGRGGDVVWITELPPANSMSWGARAVVTYESDVGLWAVSLGDVVEPGGAPPAFTNLITDGRGGFQFTLNYHTVYRGGRSEAGAVLERFAGPADSFEGPGEAIVTAQQVQSHLDARAFEAGRVGLTIHYSNPETGADSEMTVVDGAPLPALPDSCNCQTVGGRAAGGRSGFGPLALLGLLLLGRARWRAAS